jgi:UDP-glucose:glycoprotein glucosyltransferase
MSSNFLFINYKTLKVKKNQKTNQFILLSKKMFVYQHDKHYPTESTETTQKQKHITLILYAKIGSQDFKRFHEKILSLISSQINQQKYVFDFILRHNYEQIPVTSNSNKVGLSGYGVELDIKKTEYKAQDDSKPTSAASNQNSGDNSGNKMDNNNEEENLEGFMFDRLKRLNPDLNEKLDEYRKHLIESTQELAPLKAWQMQDLSFQAAQRLIESDQNEALNMLEDLSQNFPLRARSLSKIQVKNDLRKTFKSQRSVLEQKMQLEQGMGALYLNGLEINIDTVDVFALNSLLNKESRLIEGLSKIGLTLPQINDLLYLDTSSKSSDYGVDIRDSSIQWLNDLETDKKYSYWPKQMQDILRPTYPGK